MKTSNFFLGALMLGLSLASYIPPKIATRQANGTNSNSTSNSEDPMLQLSSDPDFHYEILRVLAVATYGGSDVGETLVAANQIVPGDFESFYTAFNDLANRVYNVATAIDSSKYPVSARDAMFKASTYFRSADFFLHGNWTDPRITSLWAQQLKAFNSALSLLSIPGERVVLQADGFKVPAIFYGSGLPGKRPTVILCNGYDGSQEELYHVQVKALLERGMNAITYEGPGQPTVRREQNIGFIPDWERAVTPVVDYALTRPEVDASAIGLMGYSFGGLLVARAAAFEPRIAAVIALPGLYDFFNTTFQQFPPVVQDAITADNATLVNLLVDYALAGSDLPTKARWGIQQGAWSFNAATPYDWLQTLKAFNLDGVLEKIAVPVFVGGNENDQFFTEQSEIVAAKLGSLATFRMFSNAEGAGEHCSVGAAVLQNQVALDWFESILCGKQ